MTTMRSYEFAVDNQTAVLQEKMMQLARDKKKVSLPQLLQLYAFDVIGEITVGVPNVTYVEIGYFLIIKVIVWKIVLLVTQ